MPSMGPGEGGPPHPGRRLARRGPILCGSRPAGGRFPRNATRQQLGETYSLVRCSARLRGLRDPERLPAYRIPRACYGRAVARSAPIRSARLTVALTPDELAQLRAASCAWSIPTGLIAWGILADSLRRARREARGPGHELAVALARVLADDRPAEADRRSTPDGERQPDPDPTRNPDPA